MIKMHFEMTHFISFDIIYRYIAHWLPHVLLVRTKQKDNLINDFVDQALKDNTRQGYCVRCVKLTNHSCPVLSLGKRVPLHLSTVQGHHTGSLMKHRDKFILQDCHSLRPEKQRFSQSQLRASQINFKHFSHYAVKPVKLDTLVSRPLVTVGQLFKEPANSCNIRGRYTIPWAQFQVLCFAFCLSLISLCWQTRRVVQYWAKILVNQRSCPLTNHHSFTSRMDKKLEFPCGH